MNNREFQEIYRYVSSLEERISRLEQSMGYLPCLCEGDYTEPGSSWCSVCERTRRIKFTALDRIEVKGDEHERRATGSGTTTEE